MNTQNRYPLANYFGVVAFRHVPALLITLMMTACATITPPQSSNPSPPVKQTTSEDINATPDQPEPAVRPVIVQQSAEPEPPVVIALAKQAEIEQRSGNLDRAAADLERALRIDSRNPRIWQQLAAVRLQQGDARQAEVMAGKSNQYAANDATMKKRNWQIIAKARMQSGDLQGANDAATRAAEF